ncbi:Pantothenate synthetase [Streptomyces alboniger]
MGGALPQAGAVEVDDRVPLARRLHHRFELLPRREHETGVPERKFEHERPEGLRRHRVVNPLQFGAGEDLDRYPRTLDADVKIAEQAGADTVFAPGADEGSVPSGRRRRPPAERAPGLVLKYATPVPGDFDRLLHRRRQRPPPRPDVAFGQKDAVPAARPPPPGSATRLDAASLRVPHLVREATARPRPPQPLPLAGRAAHRPRPLPRPSSPAATGMPPRRPCARGPPAPPPPARASTP